jgi:proline racemase
MRVEKMRFSKLITAVDAHTGGHPARIVTGGIPSIPGDTMLKKRSWAQAHLDDVRRLLCFEPRGHSLMAGTIFTPPVSPEADLGMLIIEVDGFLPMCGHGTIAACTVLVETGMLQAAEPVTEIALDTAAGLVTAEVSVRGGRVQDVTLRNVPSFLHSRDIEVDVTGMGKVTVDVAWGGNFYAILPAARVGLEIHPRMTGEIVARATKIRDAVNEQISVIHPDNPRIKVCTHVRFTAPSDDEEVSVKETVFFGTEGIDRSPCGTGTSAEMAARWAKGELDLNEEFVAESIVGSRFYGRLVQETKVGAYPAVVPTIRGSAYIMGIHQFVLDPRDPWPAGFHVGPEGKWGADF